MDPGDFPSEGHVPSFELSFNIGHGLSGSPLLTSSASVIGVCVGSHRVEIVDYASVFVEDDGKSFSEKHLMIESYGISHDVSSILDWKPSLFGGDALRNL